MEDTTTPTLPPINPAPFQSLCAIGHFGEEPASRLSQILRLISFSEAATTMMQVPLPRSTGTRTWTARRLGAHGTELEASMPRTRGLLKPGSLE